MLEPLLNDPKLNEAYDPDIIFCMKGLLVKKEGSNLRNEFSHGLMEPGNKSIELYFLGFFIKFISWYSISCFEERKKMRKKKVKVQAEVEEGEHEELLT